MSVMKTLTPSKKIKSSRYSSCSWRRMGLFRIGLNPNAFTPSARKNLESVAAGKTDGLIFTPHSIVRVVSKSFHHGLTSGSVDVV